MADKQLRYVITGVDKGAAKALGDVGAAGESSAKKLGSAFTRVGGQIGGELGDVLTRVGEGFDQLGAKGLSTAQKIGVTGTVLAGAGALLTAMGSKEKQSTDQLDQAITNTGHTADEFSTQIESTVHHMEKYGDTAVTTKNALATLTNATHDPAKALKLMSTAADLAAASHISLDAAAAQVAKGLGGSARIFKQYGIQVATNSDGTKDYAGAMDKLSQVIHGQADSSVNNITGKLKALRAEVEDHVAEFGQKYGPAITGIGVTMVALGPIVGKAAGAFKTFSAASVAADEEALASTGELAAGVETSAASQVGSFGTVGTSATATSDTAIAADEAAEASTASLATAVQASSAAQVSSFAEVAAGAQATAAETIAADEEMETANVALAGSADTAATAIGTVGASALASIPLIGGLVAAAVIAKSKLNIGNPTDLFKHHSDSAVIDELTQAMIADGNAVGDTTKKWLAAREAAFGLDAITGKLGVSQDDLVAGLSGTNDAFNAMIVKLDDGSESSKEVITTLKGMRDEFQKVSGSVATMGTSTDDAKTSTDALAQAEWLAKGATDARNLVIKDEITALNTLGQTQLSEAQSQDAFLSSVQGVTDAVKTNGRTLDVNTQAGRANREALLSSLSAALSYANAQQKNGVSVDKVTGALNKNVSQLEATAEAAGLSKDQVAALIKQMGLTPKQIATKFAMDTAAARNALNNIEDQLGQIREAAHVNLQLTTSGEVTSRRGGGVAGKAGGSTFFEGGATRIAEREPEIIAARGVSITPMSKLAGGGGGHNITINVQVAGIVGDPVATGRLIGDSLGRYLNAGGSITGRNGSRIQ